MMLRSSLSAVPTPALTSSSSHVLGAGLTLEEKFVGCMILSAAGDAMGFRRCDWEFCHSGLTIHRECAMLSGNKGPLALVLDPSDFPVSDDTVMHLATGESMVHAEDSLEKMCERIAQAYVACLHDTHGRAFGPTTLRQLEELRSGVKWNEVPFNRAGGGCGAAMRAMCIGLRFYEPERLDDLIMLSVESGRYVLEVAAERMTHHHPTGYLGSFTAAYFTGVAVANWGAMLMDAIPGVKAYIQVSDRAVQENLEAFSYFEEKWASYLKLRRLRKQDLEGNSAIEMLTHSPQRVMCGAEGLAPEEQYERGALGGVFPHPYEVADRDEFYTSIAWAKWGGASGHDAPMIAYDALLYSGASFAELCNRGMLHGGDSDSTGVIAGGWYGALYGTSMVPPRMCQYIEYRDRLLQCAKQLLKVANC